MYAAGWKISAFVFALVEALTNGAAYGDIQPTAGLELIEELFLHRLDTLTVSGDVDQVVSLVRIGPQVIEPIVVPHTMIEDVFIPLGANGKYRRRGGEVPLPVVLVKDVVTPPNRLTTQQRQEGLPVYFCRLRRLHAGRGYQRRGDVDVLYHLRDFHARLDHPRGVREHRHADRLLECIPLVVEAVLPERKAVVAHVEHKR